MSPSERRVSIAAVLKDTLLIKGGSGNEDDLSIYLKRYFLIGLVDVERLLQFVTPRHPFWPHLSLIIVISAYLIKSGSRHMSLQKFKTKRPGHMNEWIFSSNPNMKSSLGQFGIVVKTCFCIGQYTCSLFRLVVTVDKLTNSECYRSLHFSHELILL